jgi:hypothetical protein
VCVLEICLLCVCVLLSIFNILALLLYILSLENLSLLFATVVLYGHACPRSPCGSSYFNFSRTVSYAQRRAQSHPPLFRTLLNSSLITPVLFSPLRSCLALIKLSTPHLYSRHLTLHLYYPSSLRIAIFPHPFSPSTPPCPARALNSLCLTDCDSRARPTCLHSLHSSVCTVIYKRSPVRPSYFSSLVCLQTSP